MAKKSKKPPMWNRDNIQFPRLLAEIIATQDKLDIKSLAAEMDLTVTQVDELFERAQMKWDKYKAALVPGSDLSICDDCEAVVKSIISCPDGAEICQECFDAGHH